MAEATSDDDIYTKLVRAFPEYTKPRKSTGLVHLNVAKLAGHLDVSSEAIYKIFRKEKARLSLGLARQIEEKSRGKLTVEELLPFIG